MRPYVPQRTRDEAIDRNLDAIAATLQDLTSLPAADGNAATAAQVLTITGNITSDTVWFRGATASTATLPGAISLGSGMSRWVSVINDSAVALTIALQVGDSLSGSATVASGTRALFVSDGASKWGRMI